MEADKMVKKLIKQLESLELVDQKLNEFAKKLHAETRGKIDEFVKEIKGAKEYLDRNVLKSYVGIGLFNELDRFIEYSKNDIKLEFRRNFEIRNSEKFLKEFAVFLNDLDNDQYFFVKKNTTEIRRRDRDGESYMDRETIVTLFNDYKEILNDKNSLEYPLDLNEYKKFNQYYFPNKNLEEEYKMSNSFKMLKLGNPNKIKQFVADYLAKEQQKTTSTVDELSK